MAFQGTLYLMPRPEPYRVLSVMPSMSSGSGSGGASTVTVPGNAADIVARAAGTSLTVEEVDENTVTLSLPAFFSSPDDADSVSSQLLYIFGAASGGDLGWMTVTAKGIVGLADSSDPGGAPDYIPVVGVVTLIPSLSRPIRITPTGQFLAVSPITATFDSDGELSVDGQKNVRLIAPLWSGLSKTDWKWNAEVRPGPGQSWAPFTASFTGAPGSVVDLASAL